MLCFQVHIGTSRGLGLMTAVVPQRFVGDSKAAIMVKGVVPGHAAWTDGRVYAGDIICQVAPPSPFTVPRNHSSLPLSTVKHGMHWHIFCASRSPAVKSSCHGASPHNHPANFVIAPLATRHGRIMPVLPIPVVVIC